MDYLKYFKKSDPILFLAAKKVQIRPLSKSKNYFWSLNRSIIGQQLSTKVAPVIAARFELLFKGGKITPEAVLAIPDKKIKSIGTSWPKVSYIKDLATKVNDGALDLKTIDKLSNEEVAEKITAVKGLGPWTAEMFLMFSLGRPDVFSHGDLGLRRAIEKLYAVDNPSRDFVEELSLKWSPFRTYASMVLWETLDNKPK